MITDEQIIEWCRVIRSNEKLLNSIDNKTLMLPRAYKITGSIMERYGYTHPTPED